MRALLYTAKNNIRTTTSSFVTRMQCIENLNKIIHNKQGDVSYLFYNYAKNFFWTEVGVKAKVNCFEPCLTVSSVITGFHRNHLLEYPSQRSRRVTM